MNARWISGVLALLLGLSAVSAREVTSEEALVAARLRLSAADAAPGLAIDFIHPTEDHAAFVVRLSPTGYLVVGGDDRLPAILAFSWNADFGDLDARRNPLLDLVQADLATRRAHLDLLPDALRQERGRQWARLLGGERDGERTDYWPRPGSTTTGGWVETRWGQGSPFNDACPLDLASGQRGQAGCPSVTMAQILAYQRDTRGTRFDAHDRYHHNYRGNNFWVDDAWESYGFLSFPQLNMRLDTLDAHWSADTPLTNEDKAALVFACGVAATQVYHPQGSGTFGVNQAFAAWQRFGYDEARLLGDSDSTVYESLAANMMEGVPAHLAVVTPTWNAGHNLVVDGYNSDGYFHLNFGWNGAYDGWYLLPAELPYNLTVLEGLIVDLFPVTDAVDAPPALPRLELTGWPNPCNPLLNLAFVLPRAGRARVDVVNLMGQRVATVFEGDLAAGEQRLQWRPEVASGLYFVRLQLPETGLATTTRALVIK